MRISGRTLSRAPHWLSRPTSSPSDPASSRVMVKALESCLLPGTELTSPVRHCMSGYRFLRTSAPKARGLAPDGPAHEFELARFRLIARIDAADPPSSISQECVRLRNVAANLFH